MAFRRYVPTSKKDPFKPGDEVQFRLSTIRGYGWFLGQVWCFAPKAATYWVVTDNGEYHEVARTALRLVSARDHLCEQDKVA